MCLFVYSHIESTVDLCTGCFTLLPLNNTAALDFVHATLATLNKNVVNVTYIILEIGRMSSQVGISMFGPNKLQEFLQDLMHLHIELVSVSTSILPNTLFQFLSGGARYSVEYVIAEANCTGDTCVPLDDPTAVSTQSIALVFHFFERTA